MPSGLKCTIRQLGFCESSLRFQSVRKKRLTLEMDIVAKTLAAKPATKTRTKRRSKYITGLILCSDCTKTARKEIVGEARTRLAGEGPQPIDRDSNEPPSENLWVRCTKCHNTMLVNLTALMEEKPKTHVNMTAAECTPYSPSRIYAIGEAIYHKDWDDVGTVMSKEVTASGRNAVLVQFEKEGEKKLLENFKPE
jgi:hypothetical protein